MWHWCWLWLGEPISISEWPRHQGRVCSNWQIRVEAWDAGTRTMTATWILLFRRWRRWWGRWRSWRWIHLFRREMTVPQSFKRPKAPLLRWNTNHRNWSTLSRKRTKTKKGQHILCRKNKTRHCVEWSTKKQKTRSSDINNHLRSIDLFRSMIIKNNRSKAPDYHKIEHMKATW